MAIGRDSPILWGPELGLTEKTPPSLSRTQDLGATSRFKCFFGPRGIFYFCNKRSPGFMFSSLFLSCKFMMLLIVLKNDFKDFIGGGRQAGR
jgi:hypothetical protein